MGRDLFLNLLKLTLLGALALLLVLRVWQGDEVERRLLDLQGVVNERASRVENGVAALDDRTRGLGERLDRLAAEGVRAAPGSGIAHPPPEGGAGGPGAVDPRTLPYWPTEDNILVDPSNEPVPPADAPKGGIIRFYIQHTPPSLNRHAYNDAELTERVCWPVYEFVAERSRNDPDTFVPGLCNRVTVNEDFTEFLCYVRKGVYWHKPFLTQEEKRGSLRWLDEMPRQEATAEDVKFTFDIAKDPLSECGPALSYLADLDRVEVVDRYTARVIWKRSLYFNKDTTLSLLMIYPKFIYERDSDGRPLAPELIAPTFHQHWFNSKMCGTGPLQFAGFEPNVVIRLRRNDEWWGPRKPVIDGIDLRIVSEPPIQIAMFKAGELDILSPYPNDYRAEYLEGGPGSVKEMERQGKVTVKPWEMFVFYFVGWNMRLPQLREREVRRALAHVIPKERVIRDLLFGLGAPSDSPVHHWVNSYAKDLEQFPYDPAKAGALLDEAGWTRNAQGVRQKVVDGQRRDLKIRLLYPATSTLARDAALLIQSSAAEAGVLIEPFGREWTVMEKMLDDKDFDAALLGWGQEWDSDPTQLWHSDSARAAKGSNFVSYINPHLDEVIEGLKTTFDLERRKELWHDFQRTIVHDQPYCFFYIRTRAWFINNRLGNHYLAKLNPQEWLLPWYVRDSLSVGDK
jgi:ABC-type transport system substrate-binding protein